jgi:hypothetical protein
MVKATYIFFDPTIIQSKSVSGLENADVFREKLLVLRGGKAPARVGHSCCKEALLLF